MIFSVLSESSFRHLRFVSVNLIFLVAWCVVQSLAEIHVFIHTHDAKRCSSSLVVYCHLDLCDTDSIYTNLLSSLLQALNLFLTTR